jgi:hypothetical protein
LPQGDGEFCAQVVWHAICCVVQFNWQLVFTLALLVVVAAPIGAAPGTRQVVSHAAACELHVIMQLVTVEVCASRIFPAATATPVVSIVTAPSATTQSSVTNRRMKTSPIHCREASS